MRYEELIERVQDEGDLDSRAEAVRAIEATLSTLGECLYRTERRHLASQLPDEAKGFLSEYAEPEVTRHEAAFLTLEAFYDRVGARADVTHAHAVERAKAVLAVLRRVLPEGEWEHVLREAPEEYDGLLGQESPAPA